MNTTIKLLLLSFALMILSSCSNKMNDFDLMCDFFDTLAMENKNMTSSQKATFINELAAKKLSSDSPALESLKAVVGFEPAEGRYSLYKDAAEVTIKKDWECASIKKQLKML